MVMSGVRKCRRGHALSSPGFEGARGKSDIQLLRLLSGNSQLCRVRNGQHQLQWTTLMLMGKERRDRGLKAVLTAA